MTTFWSENKDLLILPILLAIISVSLVIGLYWNGENFKHEMQELREQQKIENDKKTALWNSFDCAGKKDYLMDKDLRSSSLFFYNINEQFYREYVVECSQ